MTESDRFPAGSVFAVSANMPFEAKYDQFVEMYCDGKTPTPLQKHAIESWLDHPKGTILWFSGRGGGKSTCLDWLRKAWQDVGTELLETPDHPHISQEYSGELE